MTCVHNATCVCRSEAIEEPKTFNGPAQQSRATLSILCLFPLSQHAYGFHRPGGGFFAEMAQIVGFSGNGDPFLAVVATKTVE